MLVAWRRGTSIAGDQVSDAMGLSHLFQATTEAASDGRMGSGGNVRRATLALGGTVLALMLVSAQTGAEGGTPRVGKDLQAHSSASFLKRVGPLSAAPCHRVVQKYRPIPSQRHQLSCKALSVTPSDPIQPTLQWRRGVHVGSHWRIPGRPR